MNETAGKTVPENPVGDVSCSKDTGDGMILTAFSPERRVEVLYCEEEILQGYVGQLQRCGLFLEMEKIKEMERMLGVADPVLMESSKYIFDKKNLKASSKDSGIAGEDSEDDFKLMPEQDGRLFCSALLYDFFKCFGRACEVGRVAKSYAFVVVGVS